MTLPGVLQDIAEIAGEHAAMRYAEMRGGVTVYLPARYDPHHPECKALADACGDAAARKIVARIGGGAVTIPSARRQRIALAVRTMQHMSVRELALMLGVSERTIYRYRRRMHAAEKA